MCAKYHRCIQMSINTLTHTHSYYTTSYQEHLYDIHANRETHPFAKQRTHTHTHNKPKTTIQKSKFYPPAGCIANYSHDARWCQDDRGFAAAVSPKVNETLCYRIYWIVFAFEIARRRPPPSYNVWGRIVKKDRSGCNVDIPTKKRW